MKDDFIEQEERNRLNPQNVLLRILFVPTYTSEQVGNDFPTERKIYSFFVNKNSNILDIKEKIQREFGYLVDQ